MIVKILGIADILAGIWMLLAHFGVVGWTSSAFFIIYLASKIFMFRDFASMLDLVSGIYFIIILFGAHWSLTYIFVIYLLQKGIFSFF